MRSTIYDLLIQIRAELQYIHLFCATMRREPSPSTEASAAEI